MMKYFLLLFCCLKTGTAYCQQTDSNSVKKLLDSAERLYAASKYGDALVLARVNVRLSKEANYAKGVARSHIVASDCLFRLGNFAGANEEALAALKLSETIKGAVSIFVGSLRQLGNIALSTNDSTGAKKYMYQAMAVAEANGLTRSIPRAYINLAVFFKSARQYDSAGYYLNKAMILFTGLKDSTSLLVLHNNFASFYLQQGNIPEAVESLQKAEQLALLMNNRMMQASVKLNRGDIYRMSGDFAKAEKFLLEGLAVADDISLAASSAEAHKYLYQLYEAKGDYKNAFIHLNAFRQISDSLSGMEKAERIQQMNAGFEAEKKDQNIALLNKENQLQTQRIEAAAKRQKLLYIAGGIALLLLVLLFYMVRQRQKARIAEMEKEKIRSELRGLKAQLNPHVLFNSLNTIFFQIDEHPEEAKETVLKYADIMRYQLYRSNADFIDIHTEIEYLTKFIDIQKIRLSDRCRLTVQIDEQLKDEQIAPLLIITIVENAFKHATNVRGIDNFIEITLKKQGEAIELMTRNSMMPGEQINVNGTDGGIGLSNLKKRLELIYPGKHKLEYGATENIFLVTLTINL
jgi:tetratricopeptide (TPR) repeat protein